MHLLSSLSYVWKNYFGLYLKKNLRLEGGWTWQFRCIIPELVYIMKNMSTDGSTVQHTKCHLGRNERTASRTVLIATISAPHGGIWQPLRRQSACLISQMLICVADIVHLFQVSLGTSWIYVLIKGITIQWNIRRYLKKCNLSEPSDRENVQNV